MDDSSECANMHNATVNNTDILLGSMRVCLSLGEMRRKVTP